jgi:hypothetical protein
MSFLKFFPYIHGFILNVGFLSVVWLMIIPSLGNVAPWIAAVLICYSVVGGILSIISIGVALLIFSGILKIANIKVVKPE